MDGMLEKLRGEGFETLPSVCAPSGVYALCGAGEVLYIGQAKNVYQRLVTHWNARRRTSLGCLAFATLGDARVNAIPYDCVIVKWVPVKDLNRIERELILRLRPRYNIQIREPLPKVNIDLASLGLRRPGDIRRRRVA